MTTESEGHIAPLDRLRIHLDGYLDGRIDEIEAEIQLVEDWPQSVRLGKTIKRKDQELEWLNRLRGVLRTTQAYINSSIEREQEKP